MDDPRGQNYLWRCKEEIVPEVGPIHSSNVCVPCSEAFLTSSAGVDADLQNDQSGSSVQNICRDNLCDQSRRHKG